MYIIPIGWLYVALMMAVAEATNTNGTVLGAVITFVLYGVAPVLLVLYLMLWPARRKTRLAREADEARQYAAAPATVATAELPQPDTGGHAPATTEIALVAPVREKP